MYEFIDWFHAVVESYPVAAYAVFFLISVGENIVPPVPGDAFIVYGGYLIGRGMLEPWPMFGATFAGHLTGFMTVYWIGRRYGRAGLRLLPWLRSAEPWIDKAERHAMRFGIALIILNRFLPGIRSAISLSVGLLRMRVWIVVSCAMVSIAVWNSLLLYLGANVGRNWKHVVDMIGRYNTVAGIVVAVAILAGVVWYIVRKRSRTLDS